MRNLSGLATISAIAFHYTAIRPPISRIKTFFAFIRALDALDGWPGFSGFAGVGDRPQS
jgi:hypothetical protein